MLQDESDSAIHLGQRANGRIRLENPFWRFAPSKVVNQDFEADARAGYADFTFA